ncbi:Tether containing UBX domain for GLUT4 [Thoreauomyces humboldtii]|nr:Tether containing UBX domain for GLUT4 [Thoreauomyces humboldtii]
MSVTLTHPSQDFKTITIKTTPSTSLKSLVAEAATKWSLGNPDSFGLKHGRVVLDLALPIRFANLAQGAKLLLVPVSNKAPGPVTVALQTPEGERLVDKFPSDTTFWAILKSWEARTAGLNLTTRMGTEERGMLKIKKPVYMMPICVFMNKEFGGIEALKQITLQKAGLSSGSGLIRVFLKATEKESVPTEEETGVPAIPANIPHVPAASKSAVSPTPAAEQSTSPIVAQPSPQSQLAAYVNTPAPAQAQSIPSIASVQVTEQTVPPTGSAMDIDLVAERTIPKSVSVEDDWTRVTHPVPMDTDIPPEASATNPAPSVKSAPANKLGDRDLIKEKGDADSATRVFHPPPDGASYNKIELPDSFYEISSSELRVLLARSGGFGKAPGSDTPLMTKAMRDRETAIKRNKYPRTMVRIRFPDRRTVQCGFLSGAELQSIREALTPVLANPGRPYTLYTTPPMRVLDVKQTFWEAGMAPACLVYFKWTDEGDEHDWLSPDWKDRVEPFPVPVDRGETGEVEDDTKEEEKAGMRRPAWLPGGTGVGSGSGSAGTRLGGAAEDKKGLFGDERDDEGKVREEKAGGSKKPKWFKIGK